MEPVRCSAMCVMPPCGFRCGDPNPEALLEGDPLGFTPNARLDSRHSPPPLHHRTPAHRVRTAL